MHYNFKVNAQKRVLMPQNYMEYPPSLIPRERIDQMPNWEKTGHWSDKQNAKYYAFLKRFKDKFNEKESRRQWKVFKSLADFIKTRNPNQCRSHHHKMKKNFETIEQTLDFLRTKQLGLEKRSQKYELKLESMDFSDFGKNINNQEEFPELKPSLEPLYPNMSTWNQQRGLMDQTITFRPDDKKLGLANANTGIDYQPAHEEKLYEKEHFFPNFNNPLIEEDLGGFPSTGLLGNYTFPDYMNISYNEQRMQISDNPFENYGLQEENPKKAKKIMECQYYFTKWMSKMQDLLADTQKDSDF